MLNLYDPTVVAETPEQSGDGLSKSEREPSRLRHTTASQLLFLVESTDVLDSRAGTLA